MFAVMLATRFDEVGPRLLPLELVESKPFAPAADAKAFGDWSLVTRDDGKTQWAYKTKPLYSFSKDSKPGDVTGDDYNHVWHIAAP